MRTREQEVEPLINLSEITEVELLILMQFTTATLDSHTGFDRGPHWQAATFEAITRSRQQLQPADRPRVEQ